MWKERKNSSHYFHSNLFLACFHPSAELSPFLNYFLEMCFGGTNIARKKEHTHSLYLRLLILNSEFRCADIITCHVYPSWTTRAFLVWMPGDKTIINQSCFSFQSFALLFRCLFFNICASVASTYLPPTNTELFFYKTQHIYIFLSSRAFPIFLQKWK